MSKKILIAVPPSLVEQLDMAAKYEHRTRSDLIREALRQYMDRYRKVGQVTIPESPLPDIAPLRPHNQT